MSDLGRAPQTYADKALSNLERALSDRRTCPLNIGARRRGPLLPHKQSMSVKLASYSYSFSASSCELHQNVYIGRSHHAEHEYDIRFAIGQTVWPLEVIKVSENGASHSVFVYRPNRLKMHQTTCRGPSYGSTQQEPDWRTLRSKVNEYAKNHIFKHGVPHSSFIYRPNRRKMHQTTCRGPSYGNVDLVTLTFDLEMVLAIFILNWDPDLKSIRVLNQFEQ